ncbi:MAG: acyltransferase, partial [Acetobacteraceae bacterium]|nr:acyltransferase [Acetobacteraceae bacterium]
MIDRKRSSETLLASAGSHPQQGYRPDIDGLRAVAVTIVLLFHIATVLPGGIVQHFLGGFVGVDVFFVISGYLITTIVRVQLGREGFRFRDFYARRAKRILPALTVVILATSFFAARYMFPTELAQFGASVIAAALSFSNIYFWLDTGYFTGPAESKLLLHTWSLA